MTRLRPARRADARATGSAATVSVVVGTGAAVYVLHRDWLGSWLSAHLTTTLVVFSLTSGLALVAAAWSGPRATDGVAAVVWIARCHLDDAPSRPEPLRRQHRATTSDPKADP